ncbi:MAG: hypothetical protein IPN71_09665 [Fibrobacteres bacterium]|nr:hypothetical protein [Fibrobacterota bacterium]
MPVRFPARRVRQATVRMDGKKAIFRICPSPRESWSSFRWRESSSLKHLVAEGQATFAHPRGGVLCACVPLPVRPPKHRA